MKTPDQLLQDVRRRLSSTWHLDVAADLGNQRDPQVRPPAWPHLFPLGAPTKAALEADFARYQKEALTWRGWACQHDLVLNDAARTVYGTTQRIPTHLTVAGVDTAAVLCGPDWVDRINRARDRAIRLRQQFPHISDLGRVIRDIDTYSVVDFDLLLTSAQWFARNCAAGLTPRQVPVPGLHAKWLNTHHRIVAATAGIPDLGLLPPHPPRLHFTYLDPDHRRTGGRWHDSVTIGDTMAPAYPPAVIVVSENKDTALHFPELPGGISVEGVGYGGGTAAAVDWLRNCPNLFYWGDMDAAGFEILNGFREAGLAATSILMDQATYDAYEPFGTNTDARGNPISPGKRKPLPTLTNDERDLYERLTDPTWKHHRRVEQERIPLAVAAAAVQKRSI